jgi:hypothetical protein
MKHTRAQEKDPPELPLDRLGRQAVQGARAAMRGKRPELVDAAVRCALRETVFRYELVLRINVTAHDRADSGSPAISRGRRRRRGCPPPMRAR